MKQSKLYGLMAVHALATKWIFRKKRTFTKQAMPYVVMLET